MKHTAFLLLSFALLTTQLTPGCATSDPALAQEIDGLRQEISELRAEIQELKKARVLAEGLPIRIPVRPKEGTPGPDLIVTITKDGSLSLGPDPVSKEDLKKRFEETAAKSPDTMLVMKADASVSHQWVVEVVDLAKAAGLSRFAIAVEDDSQ